MPSKRTIDRRRAVHERCLAETRRALELADVLEAELKHVREESHQLQKLTDEAQTRNEELLQRIGDLRDTVKDLEKRLEFERGRARDVTKSIDNISMAAYGAGRLTARLLDLVDDADLVLKPREKK
jgi:chromosome segregation ATPase